MKKIMTSMFILLGMTLFAQDCKPYKKVQDDFLDKKVSIYGAKIGTERSMLLGVSVTSYVLVTKTNDSTYSLIFNMQYYQQGNDASVNNIKYPTGTSFDLRTATEVKTYTSETVRNKKMKVSSKTLSICELVVTVSKEDIEFLRDNTLLAYRITPAEGSTTQGKIDEKKALKLQSQMSCLLDNKVAATSDSEAVESPATDLDKTQIKENSNISSYFGIHAGIRSYYYNDYTSNSPLLTVSYEQGIIKPLGIRAFIGYGRAKDGGDVDRYLSFGASVIYYPYIREKLKLYLSGGLGLSRDIGYYWLPVSLLARGGARYQFNETLGAYADIGFGLSIVNLGISFKMISKK
jgi:hypothetical protein